MLCIRKRWTYSPVSCVKRKGNIFRNEHFSWFRSVNVCAFADVRHDVYSCANGERGIAGPVAYEWNKKQKNGNEKNNVQCTQHNETDFRAFRRCSRSIHRIERCFGCVLATTVHIYCAIVWIRNESLHFVLLWARQRWQCVATRESNVCGTWFVWRILWKFLDEGSLAVLRLNRKNQTDFFLSSTPKWCRRFVFVHTSSARTQTHTHTQSIAVDRKLTRNSLFGWQQFAQVVHTNRAIPWFRNETAKMAFRPNKVRDLSIAWQIECRPLFTTNRNATECYTW